MLDTSVLIESASPPRQPFSAGRREAGFMAEPAAKDNRKAANSE
jgi:hypothetical protein